MSIIVRGSVDANGNIISGTKNFSVSSLGGGRYKINFSAGFTQVPAVVATQNNFASLDQWNTDSVVVPVVNQNYCQINTGTSHTANPNTNRPFAFIAMGD